MDLWSIIKEKNISTISQEVQFFPQVLANSSMVSVQRGGGGDAKGFHPQALHITTIWWLKLLDFLPVNVQHEHYEHGKKRLYWFKSGYGKFNVLKWEQWHIKKKHSWHRSNNSVAPVGEGFQLWYWLIVYFYIHPWSLQYTLYVGSREKKENNL